MFFHFFLGHQAMETNLIFYLIQAHCHLHLWFESMWRFYPQLSVSMHLHTLRYREKYGTKLCEENMQLRTFNKLRPHLPSKHQSFEYFEYILLKSITLHGDHAPGVPPIGPFGLHPTLAEVTWSIPRLWPNSCLIYYSKIRILICIWFLKIRFWQTSFLFYFKLEFCRRHKQ